MEMMGQKRLRIISALRAVFQRRWAIISCVGAPAGRIAARASTDAGVR